VAKKKQTYVNGKSLYIGRLPVYEKRAMIIENIIFNFCNKKIEIILIFFTWPKNKYSSLHFL